MKHGYNFDWYRSWDVIKFKIQCFCFFMPVLKGIYLDLSLDWHKTGGQIKNNNNKLEKLIMMRFVPNNSGVISQFQVDGWPKMCCCYPNTLAHQRRKCAKFTIAEVHYRKSLTRTLDTIYYKASCPLIITWRGSSEQPPHINSNWS